MADSTETAFLAGGCAWIMQPLLSQPGRSDLHSNGLDGW